MSLEFDAQAFKQFERDGYSSVAEGYANKTAQVSAQTNDAILAAAEIGPGSRLLDVACGPGLLSAAALARGVDVAAIDFAPNMVDQAKRRCPSATVQEADAEALPFEDACFDAVVCSLGILHFPKPEAAAAEAFRVLKPGGRYVFTCWTPPAVNPFMGLMIGAVANHGTMEIDLPPGPPLFRFGDPDECKSLLRGAGFQELTLQECPFHWPTSSGEALLEELHTSGARLGPMIAKQTVEARQAVEQAIISGAEAFRTDGELRIPSAVNVASGRKP